MDHGTDRGGERERSRTASELVTRSRTYLSNSAETTSNAVRTEGEWSAPSLSQTPTLLIGIDREAAVMDIYVAGGGRGGGPMGRLLPTAGWLVPWPPLPRFVDQNQ